MSIPRNASPEMRPFSDIEDDHSHSHSHHLLSLLLAIVAPIPNHTLRYTALGLLFVLVALCTVHLRSPSAQLCHLALLIDQTEELIRRAMAQCPRGYFGLTEEMGRLLQQLSTDIAACAKRVRSIRTAVLHIIEAGHQRKLEADIKETEPILAAASTRATPPMIPSTVAS
ncbi:hypothetical protein B0H13DRAFT_2382588 [Mycena leptocephala]|nr:hypothetical protein B0H13DRAFT_2382588 [Mycena leptocephala]